MHLSRGQKQSKGRPETSRFVLTVNSVCSLCSQEKWSPTCQSPSLSWLTLHSYYIIAKRCCQISQVLFLSHCISSICGCWKHPRDGGERSVLSDHPKTCGLDTDRQSKLNPCREWEAGEEEWSQGLRASVAFSYPPEKEN